MRQNRERKTGNVKGEEKLEKENNFNHTYHNSTTNFHSSDCETTKYHIEKNISIRI